MPSFAERVAELASSEFAFPGPLRDQLVAAILDGTKTSTASLLADYAIEGEPLPKDGERFALVDSDDEPVAIIEVTEVRPVRLDDVDLQHAIDEGEGYETVAEWRSAHEDFWRSDDAVAERGETVTISGDTIVILERFRVVERPEEEL